jgi:acetoin utilization deacetylase AcuC-like enzyme
MIDRITLVLGEVVGIANLALVEADYAWITHQLKAIASAYSEGRIVSTLEGRL